MTKVKEKKIDPKEESKTKVLARIKELKDFRSDVFGVDINKIWEEAASVYLPHSLRKRSQKKVLVSDDELGWRSRLVRLGDSEWQEDSSTSMLMRKLHTAFSILVDRNPEAILFPGARRYEKTSKLMEAIYKRSWSTTHSRQQLKNFVFYQGLFGFGVGITAPRILKRNYKDLVEAYPNDPEKNRYEEKEVVVFDDIFREALNPWNVWLDDMARLGDPLSVNDWVYRRVISESKFKQDFKDYSNLDKAIKATGDLSDIIGSGSSTASKKITTSKKVEIYRYENLIDDQLMILANGEVMLDVPLPRDIRNKRLSVWYAPFQIRNPETVYGIGLWEMMKYDEKLFNKLRNMTIDQLVLSIYKMFFFEGTDNISDDGKIIIRPGYGKQVVNAKNVNWIDVPGPGAESWKGLDWQAHEIDEATGITPTLEGDVTGKTAYEIAQAREQSLKRLKTPLDFILAALEEEGYITLGLAEEMYSLPEIKNIVEPDEIEEYQKQAAENPEYFELEDQLDEEGIRTGLVVREMREIPLDIEKTDGGDYIQSEKTRFIRLLPENLHWEGIIHIRPQSILGKSVELDKQMKLELFNLVVPLIQQGLKRPLLIPEIKKAVMQILKVYEEDPKDWLPDSWMQEAMSPEIPLVISQMMGARQPGGINNLAEAETVVPSSEVEPMNERGAVGKMMGQISPFQ